MIRLTHCCGGPPFGLRLTCACPSISVASAAAGVAFDNCRFQNGGSVLGWGVDRVWQVLPFVKHAEPRRLVRRRSPGVAAAREPTR